MRDRLTLIQQVLLIALVVLGLLIGWAWLDLRSRAELDLLLDEQAAIVTCKDDLAAINLEIHRARLEENYLVATRRHRAFKRFRARIRDADGRGRMLWDASDDAALREHLELMLAALASYEQAVGSIDRVQQRLGLGFAATEGERPQIDALEAVISIDLELASSPGLALQFANLRVLERDFTTSLDMRISSRLLEGTDELMSRLPVGFSEEVRLRLKSYRDRVDRLTRSVVELELAVNNATLEFAQIAPYIAAVDAHLDSDGAVSAIALREHRQATNLRAAGLFGLAFALSLAFLMWQLRGAGRFARRVHELATTMKEVADGNFGQAGGLPATRDEIGALAGSFRRMVSQIHEQIGALEAAREDAELANRSKSTFLATMSHELRTPLNAIIGYAELITEEFEADDDVLLRDIGRIRLSARHLLGLINDILDISKIEAGEVLVESYRFPITEVILEACAAIEPLLTRGGNHLVIEIDSELGEATTDKLKIRQILINLLGNAAKFTEKGTIALGARLVGAGQVEFWVRDSGIGISLEQQENLFEPFVQAENSTARRFGGTGLGLTICRHFTELLGGTIGIESEVGRGSVFTVRMPVEAPVRSIPAASGHKLRRQSA